MPEPIPIFMLSYQRPMYLWAALDAMYRHTTYPCRIIIADNASPDPLVREVIKGFEARGLFHAVHLCDDNDPNRLTWMMKKYSDLMGEYCVYAETDMLVLPSSPCWLTTFVQLMTDNPNLGMLGSKIDTTDFIDLDHAKRLRPDIDVEYLKLLIKFKTAERHIEKMGDDPIITPFNPPGRLMMLRTEALKHVPVMRDSLLHKGMIENGYETGISTGVRHRHLSLLNFFDYNDYDMNAREDFFSGMDSGKPVVDSDSSEPA